MVFGKGARLFDFDPSCSMLCGVLIMAFSAEYLYLLLLLECLSLEEKRKPVVCPSTPQQSPKVENQCGIYEYEWLSVSSSRRRLFNRHDSYENEPPTVRSYRKNFHPPVFLFAVTRTA